MRSFYVNAILLCALVSTCLLGFAQGSCGTDRERYAAVSQQLLIKSQADAKRLTPEEMERITRQLHVLVRDVVLTRLAARESAAEIAGYIQCIQASREADIWKDETNEPQAISIAGTKASSEIVLIAYWFVRGGNAVPSTRPFVDVYRKDTGTNRSWRYIQSFGEELVGSTFFLEKIARSDGRRPMVLLHGMSIGDPQTPLHLVVLGVRGGEVDEVYRSQPLPRARISEVTRKAIVIEQSDAVSGVSHKSSIALDDPALSLKR